MFQNSGENMATLKKPSLDAQINWMTHLWIVTHCLVGAVINIHS